MNFYPEGCLFQNEENQYYLKNEATLNEALRTGTILEARAVMCDNDHNLIVDLGNMTGVIPARGGAIGIENGATRDIALISRVNKLVCFMVTGFRTESSGKNTVLLSRRKAQEVCTEQYLSKLVPGDIIQARVTHLEQFGCFVDIGCGVPSLIPIDAISISRISHPSDRFKQGQMIFAVVKNFTEDGRICLTHKELLGTWEENANHFRSGETVSGIIRSIENYGIFVELTPNLAGLAELKEGIKSGQFASVYIKSLIPDKMKIKLIIVDSFDEGEIDYHYHYYQTSGHLDHWRYSPENSSKIIETKFDS